MPALHVIESGDACGAALFTGMWFQEALQRAADAARDEAVRQALISYEPLSRLRLRRIAITAATHDASIVLGAPQFGGVEVRGGWHHAVCIVPFSGDDQLFRLSVKGYPVPRPLRGIVSGQKLIVRVRVDPEDAVMIGPLLASEIDAIADQVIAQHEVSKAHNKSVPDAIRTFVADHYDVLMAKRSAMRAAAHERARIAQNRRIDEMLLALGLKRCPEDIAKILGIEVPKVFQ